MVVNIDLDKENSRPIISVETKLGNISCLLDTGANRPVWCLDKTLLKLAFPDAARYNELVTTISGFGGESRELSEVWEIPKLIFKDRNNEAALEIKNIPITILKRESIGFSMILSATMFNRMDCTLYCSLRQVELF